MKSIARKLLLVPVLATAFAVLPMLSSGAELSAGCAKVQGTVSCFSGPGNNQAGVGTTSTTQGNTTNFSPVPQGTGTSCNPPKSQGVC
jgi:hypothetical protein